MSLSTVMVTVSPITHVIIVSPSTSAAIASSGTPVATLSPVVAMSPPPTQELKIRREISRPLAVLKEKQLILRKVTWILLPIRDIMIRAKLQQSPGKGKCEQLKGKQSHNLYDLLLSCRFIQDGSCNNPKN